MRRLLPDSTASWVILVLVAGVIGTQVLAIAIHYSSRRESVVLLESFRIAERVATLAEIISDARPELRPAVVDRVSRPTLSVTWDPESAVDPARTPDWKSQLLSEVVTQSLQEVSPREVRVSYLGADDWPSPVTADSFASLLSAASTELRHGLEEVIARHQTSPTFFISVQLPDSTWLNFAAPYVEAASIWSNQSLILIGAMVLAVIALSIWVLHRLTTPLRTLALAAQRLGVDVAVPPLPERGPREVRQAIRAFNDMQFRLRRFVDDRTRMIAAISHDLRTPITRLRLRAEFVDDPEQQQRMLADLGEMETMIRATLAFAKEEADPEPRQSVDLVSLLESVCQDWPEATLTLADEPRRLAYLCQPVGMRRGLTNLVANAVKYGDRARVTLSRTAADIAIAIDDDGPGIPEDEMENVFRPFYRVEHSRSRDTGGTGLGLSVARAVFRAHGGDVTLANRAEGGLRATVTLPRQG
jgi:signal transduction histidine kinase